MAKVDKYLKDIKELSPEFEEDTQAEVKSKVSRRVSIPQKSNTSQPPRVDKEKVGELRKELGLDLVDSDLEKENAQPKKSLPISTKDIILGLINIISIILLIIILVRFPSKANELKNLRIEKIKSESGSSFEFSDIESHRNNAQALSKLFLEEPGIVDFVNSVEKLKADEGAIKKISFASQKVLKDKTGNFGIPVVIELSGSWEAIKGDLKKIEELPFLFRAANIETKTTEEGVILFKYGGFLYVSDELGKNR